MSSSQASLRSSNPILLVIPSVGAARDGDFVVLDQKLLTGWTFFASHWPGRTRFLFREIDPKELTFGKRCRAQDLPGDIEFVRAIENIPDASLSAASVILGAGDSFDSFELAKRARRLGTPLCYVIEYTLATRLRIEAERPRSLVRKARTMVWLIGQERRRRAAFRAAAALQANGVPAADAYRNTTKDLLTYFDTRLFRAMAATDDEIHARIAHLGQEGPLRLAFTGRLEPLKGAHHLIPVARHLLDLGVDFRLDVYGSGSLQTGMEKELEGDARLRNHVTIHKPIDFTTELVPLLRSSVDLFVCCHIQGDPSCTYSETLGCGVPIVGYDNEAWRGMLRGADLGWSVKLGDSRALAAKIALLSGDRANIAAAMWRARDFGRDHCFEEVFETRIRHLEALAAAAVDRATRDGNNRPVAELV